MKDTSVLSKNIVTIDTRSIQDINHFFQTLHHVDLHVIGGRRGDMGSLVHEWVHDVAGPDIALQSKGRALV